MDEKMIRIDAGDLERRRDVVAPRHRFVDQQRELVEVLDPAVNLCVWRRAIGTGLARWLDEMRTHQTFVAQADLAAGTPDASALVASLTPGAERDELQADIERVAGSYLALVGASAVLATLATIADDSCRRFHVDQVGIRAICTYAGPGTLWLPESSVLRIAAERRAGSVTVDERIVVADDAAAFSLERGWVGLFKGTEWPGNRQHGAVHRSPRMIGDAAPRVLLTLDVDVSGRFRLKRP